MAKHKQAGFNDHPLMKYRGRKADYARARHRKIGPPMEPSMYDMTSEEFTQIKGAGPSY